MKKNPLAEYVRQYRGRCLAVLLLIALTAATAQLPPLLLGRFIDWLTAGQTVLTPGFLYLALSIAADLAESGQNSAIIALGQHLMHVLRSRMAAKLTRLPASYYTAHPAGETSSRLLNDVDAVNVLFTEGIVTMLASSLRLVLTLGIIFWTNIALGLLLACVLPALYAFTQACQRRVHRAQLQQRSAIAAVFACLPETLQNLPLIRSFGTERFMYQRYAGAIADSFRATEQTNFFDSVYSPIIKTLTAALIATMMVLAAGESTRALFGLSVGQAVAMTAYILSLFAPLEALGMEIQHIQTATAALERVRSFLALPELPLPAGKAAGTVPPAANTESMPVSSTDKAAPAHTATDTASSSQTLSASTPACVFADVSFSYDGQTPVIQHFNLTVQPGEHVVIRGRTGAGKTTLFRLLTGLYPPTQGTVPLCGQAPDQIAPEQRRLLFGIVEQDCPRVAGTLRDQLTLAQGEQPTANAETQATKKGDAPDASPKNIASTALAKQPAAILPDSDLWALLDVTGLTPTVEKLPQGLDTPIGQVTFSEGQWQLLALARALACDPPLLLLDEFTAHLDTATAQHVLQTLTRAARHRTIIAIAHHGATLPQARYIDL